MKTAARQQKGFTLIELLVVIGILAVLLAITLIAINPARQFQQANDTQRKSDVNATLNAIHQYMADHAGSPPPGITATATNIGSGATDVNLCPELVPTYIADLPRDPVTGAVAPANTPCSSATSYSTGYTVASGASNRITVSAQGQIINPIQVTR